MKADVVVIGAGIAGLHAGLCAAGAGASVLLVTKGGLRTSNSFMAQGGIAAAIGPDDDPSDHLADTVRAGRGLCDVEAVRVLVDGGAGAIAGLERLGVRFDRDPQGQFQLGREGGHGRNRILHAGGSATGAAVAEALIAGVAATPTIRVLEHTAAIGLLADDSGCAGVWALGHDELLRLSARMTMIATGGAGALFARTTNPPGATGDGIALAVRAGADVADMEFVQFHPTALAVGERAFLISEAVRGEGAHLVTAGGERIMPAEHPDAELAPRDVVTRVLQARVERGEPTYLSLRHLDAAAIAARFPNLVAGCAAQGLDLATQQIPVAPAAHYLMGGIATDLDGATSVPGLYAVGECAATGVHGANRLASNSLLECFVFSRRAIAVGLDRDPVTGVDAPTPEPPIARAPLAELRRRMWSDCGPVRDERGLRRMIRFTDGAGSSAPVLVSSLIAQAALRRTESRGAHLRRDYPQEDPAQCVRQRQVQPSTL
jgi:L-aspartate oxidase